MKAGSLEGYPLAVRDGGFAGLHGGGLGQGRSLRFGHGENLLGQRAELPAQQFVLLAADFSVRQLFLELGQLGAQPPVLLGELGSDFVDRRDDAASPPRAPRS